MKKVIFLTLSICSYLLFGQGFSNNEYLKYRVHYGFINAGFASLSISEVNYLGKPHWHVTGKGNSTGAVSLFFKVRDNYETYIDQQTIRPSKFIRKINEGGYTKNKVLLFDNDKKLVYETNYKNNRKTTYRHSTDIQDMLSAFYFLRNFNKSEFPIGSIKTVKVFMDGEIYSFKLKVLGKETIDTQFGEIKCIKMRPYVQSGRVFKAQESVTIWISDDDNLIPILLQADLAVGSLKMSLYEYKNTKYPLIFK